MLIQQLVATAQAVIWGAKTPERIEPKFVWVVDVLDVITPFKFGDDWFRGFWLAEGQSLHFCHRL